MGEKYVYHGIDITLDIYEKITKLVEKIAENEEKNFDVAYENFIHSSLYEVLRNTDSLMWSESVEYLYDEYYRRKAV